MTTVHLLTTTTHPNSFALNFPLQHNKKLLNSAGVKVVFFSSITDHLFNCDILAINSKFFRPWWHQRESELLEQLERFTHQVTALIWFDTADSSGTTQFKVLPFVHGYYKNQLLKNKRAYLQTYYGSRTFTDFYHHQFGICDEDEFFTDCPATEKDLEKINLSWNFGLGDYGPRAKTFAKLRKILPFWKSYSAQFTPINQERPIAITARLGRSYTRPTIRFQREKTIECLTNFFNVDTTRISPSAYYQEMQTARICVSPFGWGEMAYRDFEAIICGAILFKPDMSHLETWPDIYQANITYVPYRWDFTDLQARLSQLITQKNGSIIAQNAQDLYCKTLFSTEGRETFCQRFINIVRQHKP